MSTITLNLKGRIPSKKNSKRIISVRGRPMVISSKEYIEWESRAAFELGVQASKYHIHFPIEKCSISMEFIFPDRRRTDISNKIESLMDALVRARVIADDCWTVVSSLTAVATGMDKDKAGAKITILEYPKEREEKMREYKFRVWDVGRKDKL